MSVAQQRGEPDEQRPAWRSSRGAAYAAAARARMMRYCILIGDLDFQKGGKVISSLIVGASGLRIDDV
jgi:hypothetical protein